MYGKHERAYSWDFDDTIIRRDSASKSLNAVTRTLSRDTKLIPLNKVPYITRVVEDKPIQNWREHISLYFHSRRKVIPGVKQIIERAELDGVHNFGNTGRLSKKIWVDMTENTLDEGGIWELFNDSFYTPEGLKPVLSKAAGIKLLQDSYEQVAHFDDDPRTSIILASMFPDVTIYLVGNGRSGPLFSRKETKQFPNIRRIVLV